MSPRTKRWSSRLLTLLAIAYPLTLAGICLLLRYAGERWWVTGVALYLPRFGFVLPLPLLVLLIGLARRWRLLWSQLAAACVLLPLLGFNLATPFSTDDTTRPRLRVLSYNVNSGYGDFRAVAQEVSRFAPDVVLIQELFTGSKPLEDELRKTFAHLHVSTQFLVASRYPLSSVVDPERLDFFGAKRSPRFMKYVVDSPLGPITIFNVHPVSPRGGVYAIRGDGLRRELSSGRLLRGSKTGELQSTAALRRLQIATVARLAQREAGPVLIAGDTNLPALSPIFAELLGDYQDGFDQQRTGFGYTYPAKLPWMRIDRILANDRLRFLSFETGSSRASDHFCVVADVGRAP
jgi:vancomycin resistance protein VanJ